MKTEQTKEIYYENGQNKRLFDELNNFYSITKTLRFELRPLVETEKYLEDVLEKDFFREENYEMAKKQIDDEYRRIIDINLSDTDIDFTDLYNYYLEYNALDSKKGLKNTDSDKSNKIELNKAFENLDKEKFEFRKKVLSYIKKDDSFNILTKGKFIENIINESLDRKEDEIKGVEAYRRFITYFTGFLENRKNVFTEEEKTTALAFRTINVNFEKFIMNMEIFKSIRDTNNDIIINLEKNMKDANVISDSESIDDYFELNSYNRMILQEGINKYNSIIGGISLEKEKKIKGINELTKEFNDKGDRSKHIPKMMKLYKQILSTVERDGFKFETIDSDKELLKFNKDLFYNMVEFDLEKKIEEIIDSKDEFDLEKIYISDKLINSISAKEFGDYSQIINNMRENLIANSLIEKELQKGKKQLKLTLKEESDINKSLGWDGEEEINSKKNKQKYFSLAYIQENAYPMFVKKGIDNFNIRTLLLKEFKNVKNRYNEKKDALAAIIEEINETNIKEEKNLSIIKTYLDCFLDIHRLVKDVTPSNILSLDSVFYYLTSEIGEQVEIGNEIHNKTRNYVTKVSFSSDKIKLMFNFPALASGWSTSKEKDNGAIIFRKEDKYFLGILNSNKKVEFNKSKNSDTEYKKMEYYLFKGPNKMFPKCMFTKDVKTFFKDEKNDKYLLDGSVFREPFEVTRELYEVYNKEYNGKKKFQKGYLDNKGTNEEQKEKAKEYRKALNIAIDGCKDFITKYKSLGNFDFSNLRKTEEYESIDEFYGDVERMAYKMEFVGIEDGLVEKEVKNGNLYLFEIYNKDFSEFSRGKKNLHTMYFLELFGDDNKQNYDIRLQGNAEIFFRKKSIDNPVVHKKGEKIVPKTYLEDGVRKSIPSDLVPALNEYINGNKEIFNGENSLITKQEADEIIGKIDNIRELEYDITKNKRYTFDKFFFHVPISLNSSKVTGNISDKIDKMICENEFNVIGIDRGERNLIYVSVIDPKGNILEQKSLNIINGFDYHEKLDIEEKRRNNARKSWKTIGKIKDLKSGYISAAVHEITRMAVKYNAFIVMENLNTGFKRSRLKFEKQIYQKFEKQLTEKLNYLVFKERDPKEVGGTLNGYQLTTEFNERAAKNGIIFYVPASYTSKIDPVTGFINGFKLGMIKNLDAKKEFLSKINYIKYDNNLDMFAFDFDYKNFDNVLSMDKTEWTVFTNGTRIVYQKDTKTNISVDLTKELKEILNDCNIEYKKGNDILKNVIEDTKLVSKFFYIFSTALQMRNSIPRTNIDYIISPVKDKDGVFYDSRYSGEKLPVDSDANGAFNIARKGSLILNMNKGKDYKNENLVRTLRNQEWLKHVQK